MTEVGGTLTKSVTLPVMALGSAIAVVSSNFEAAMSEVAAITGAVGDDFEALEGQAKDLGETTQFSASEAAEGMKYLGMAGMDTNEIMNAMPGLLDLAAASGTELGTTADIVSDALSAFGMEAQEAGHLADIMAKASSTANTNVEMLGESFKYAAPVAASFGMSAEETTAALAMMANSGIKASQAGTTLRASLTNLAKPSKQAGEWLDKLKISTTDTNGAMLPFNEIMGQLRVKYADLSEEQRLQATSSIFGKQAMSGMLAVLNTGTEDFEEYTKMLENSDGSAKKMADTMNDNLQGSFKLLKSALEGAAISLGETLIPLIRDVVEWINKWVTAFNSLDEGTKEMIVKIGLIAGAIGPLLLVAGKLVTLFGSISKTITLIKAGFAALGSSTAGAGTAMTAAGGSASGLGAAVSSLLAPIALIVAAVAGFIAIVVKLYKENEEFRDNVHSLWDSIKTNISVVLDKIIELFEAFVNIAKGLFEAFVNTAKWLWEIFGDDIGVIVNSVMKIISNIFDTTFKILIDILNIFIDIFTGNWSKLWEDVKKLISDIWNGIIGFIEVTLEAIINIILNIVPKMLELGKNIFKALWDGLVWLWDHSLIKWLIDTIAAFIRYFAEIDLFGIGKDILNGLIDGLKNMWGSVKDVVGDIAESVKDKFKAILGIESPSKVFKEFGKNIDEGLEQGIRNNQPFVEIAMKDLGEMVQGSMESTLSFATQMANRIINTVTNARSFGNNLSYDSSSGYTWGKNKEGKTDTGNRKHDRNNDGRTSVWESNKSRAEEERNWVKNNPEKSKEIVDKVEKEHGYTPTVGEIKDRYISGDYHTGGLVNPARSLFQLFHDGGWVNVINRLSNLEGDEVPAILQEGEFVLSRDMINNTLNAARSLKVSASSLGNNFNMNMNFDYDRLAEAFAKYAAKHMRPSVNQYNEFVSPEALDERTIRREQTILMRNLGIEWGL